MSEYPIFDAERSPRDVLASFGPMNPSIDGARCLCGWSGTLHDARGYRRLHHCGWRRMTGNAMTASALYWNAKSVAELMFANGIDTRDGLARSGLVSISRAGLYRTFNSDWAGRARPDVLAQLSVALNAPLGQLVHDPRWIAAEARRRGAR